MIPKFKKLKAKADEAVAKHKNDLYATMAAATAGALTMPTTAFADASSMLSDVLSLASKAVILVGGALVVWGGVKFGLAIKDHQGGNAMAEALATMGGGAIIVVAGGYFTTLSL
jgi:hypothetical protein